MEQIEAERSNPFSLKKVREDKLPKVNRELAVKLQEEMNMSKEGVNSRWRKKVLQKWFFAI